MNSSNVKGSLNVLERGRPLPPRKGLGEEGVMTSRLVRSDMIVRLLNYGTMINKILNLSVKPFFREIDMPHPYKLLGLDARTAWHQENRKNKFGGQNSGH
jgi:hypothetical protein